MASATPAGRLEARVVVRHDGDDRDVELVCQPGALVADVVRALIPDSTARGVLVDGGFVPAGRAVVDAGIVHGSLVEVADGPTAAVARGRATAALAVVGGLDAGRAISLAPGAHTVGRTATLALDHPTVSGTHAVVTVGADGAFTVADLGSRNGTWRGDQPIGSRPEVLAPGEVLRVGALDITVRSVRTDDAPVTTARRGQGAPMVPVNRPPRPTAPPRPPVVALPEPPPVPPSRPPFPVTAVALGLALALGLATIGGSTTFAFVALLGPLTMAGAALAQRRRGARAIRRADAAQRRALDAFAAAVAAAAAAERTRSERDVPDLAEVVRRATLPSVQLLERRTDDPAVLRLRAGTATQRWTPDLEGPPGARTAAVDAVLDAHGWIESGPVDVDLSRGGVVGVVGDREAALAVARALVVQAAVHHGPADLGIAVVASPAAEPEWDWVKWLPHAGAPGALVATEPTALPAIVDAAVARDAHAPPLLVVVDGEPFPAELRAAVAALLPGRGGPRSGIVLAASADRLPATCTTVVELRGADGLATVHRLDRGGDTTAMLATGCGPDVARSSARALARFGDPEAAAGGAGLPATVGLLDLLAPDHDVDACIERAWAQTAPLRAPLGIGAEGVVEIDLERDGPHALVAGTTGSGKSELLRTLVAGLAARVSPDDVTFLLVDFKGGSAFDACARLPHVVGLVTDLDEHLAARALRCLDAELRHRERVLRGRGAPDLAAYRRVAGDEPLPRLVVVVDELASLKAEVPGFVDALVGVAQRGRSLGVHLVLATQRPAGVVTDDIRANTSLRVALRVEDAPESVDVIGVATAAAISRRSPGRAFVRRGPDAVVALQTARATTLRACGPPPAVAVRPFNLGPPSAASGGHGHDSPTDLDAVVDACALVFARSGAAPPRRPWIEPLPAEVDLAGLARHCSGGADAIAFAWADDPDHQCRLPHSWSPRSGNLLVIGSRGSGTTTALTSIAVAAAARSEPTSLHLYAVDGGGGLDPLAVLPHCGAVIGAGDTERVARLLRTLRSEVAHRRAAPGASRAGAPTIVLLVDGYATFAAERADLAGLQVVEDLARVFADGPAVGVHTVVAAERAGAVPAALTALTRQRLVLRLADPHDHVLAGLSGPPPSPLVPGRGVDVETALVLQVARPAGGLAAAVTAIAAATSLPGSGGPAPIGALPICVPVGEVTSAAQVAARPWLLPVGVGEQALRPVGLELHDGEHALVAGPPRSGRSSALLAIATGFRVAAPHGRIVALASSRSPLRSADVELAADAERAVASLERAGGPALLLVDDAETVDDATGALAALVASASGSVAVIAAGRADALRAAYGHWTREVRRSRVGLLLQPDVDLDGELVGASLPRRAPVALTPGRGWLCRPGAVEVVQVAT